jgi:tetratricopeptide (TPR) repeat protein
MNETNNSDPENSRSTLRDEAITLLPTPFHRAILPPALRADGGRERLGAKMLQACAVALLLTIVSATANGQPAETAKPEEVLKAESLFRDGKIDDALKQFHAAVKKHPQLPPAELMLARLLFSAGQHGPGRAHLEKAIAESPGHPEVYLANASQALAEGRVTDTILNCQIALAQAGAERWPAEQRKKWQREARIGLATAFEARQDWEAARTQILAWLELEPKNGQARQRLARALLMQGRDTEAFNELQQASKDDAALDPAEVTMGRLWSLRGDAKQAEEWFEKAVRKYPREARVHRAYGGWLLDRGRIDAAKVHIDTAAKLEPKSRESLGLQGLLARYTKDYETAVKIFEDLVRDEPGNFYPANHLALASAELPDKRARAVQLAELNARQYPSLSDALATLGWVYFKSNRIDEAERLLQASASGGQVSSDTAYYYARVLKERGKTADVKELLKKALDSDGPFVSRADAKALYEELSKAK